MDTRLEALTQDTLTPLVRQALANPAAEIKNWRIDTVYGGWGSMVGGTAIYRVSGQTHQNRPWSLILKVLYERPGEAEDSPYYWKREYELYRSGLLAGLPDVGLTTPIFYDFAEFADSCWVWMEDVAAVEREWTLEDYHLIARHLGCFNGAYLTGHAMPAYPWLTSNWHCQIVPPLADTFSRLDEYLQDPLVQRALPLAEKATILAIWNDYPRYCDTLTSLPQTLCHLDVFRGNLLRRDSDTVLIDWALAGRGAVGEDLVAFVALSLYRPVAQAETVDQTVFNGYVEGLRDAGWTGDSRLARLGYVCAMTLRGLAGVKQDIGLLLDENKHPKLLRSYGRGSLEATADLFADIRRFRLIRMAAETRHLLDTYG